MNNALLEIGTEHLPARFLIPTLNQMQQKATEILTQHNLKFVSVKTYGTYKRLVLEVTELATKAEDIQKEVKGPPAKMLKDEQGNFTQQAIGFAAKNGLDVKQLTVVETDKGPFIYAKVKIKGEKTLTILPQIFTEIVKGLTFPKNMVWEETNFRFARPIRSLIGLYGAKVVDFEVAGVKSGRNTFPITSFGRKPIKIASPEVYAETLKNQPQPILVKIEDREKALRRAVESAAAKLGYIADMDDDLITETVSFTEHPVVLSGDFDIKFLTLPKELITTVLKKQIKMFPVLNEKGEIQPHFIAVRDGISVNQDEVRTGFKNVMTARLTDAVFFFNNDLKNGLPAMREKLNTVNFIDGMGNMIAKTERVKELSLWLAQKAALDNKQTEEVKQAADFCYADLTGGVVYEFAELQGYMGGVYAQKTGYPQAVATALQEFYLPLTASSKLPQSTQGALVSLAGKLDSLAANFAVGQVPSGSEDPFALRRQAMGAVRIITDKNLNLTLQELIDKTVSLLPKVDGSQTDKLYDFMWQRMANILEQHGLSADEIAAVSGLKNRTLNQIVIIALALKQAKESGDISVVAEAAKRVSNILKKAQVPASAVDEKLFEHASERALYGTLTKVKAEISKKLDYNITKETCLYSFERLAEFKTPLEDFFNNVMVNAENPAIKNNRLALLKDIDVVLTLALADLTKLVMRG